MMIACAESEDSVGVHSPPRRARHVCASGGALLV